jgi:hypothetical protein
MTRSHKFTRRRFLETALAGPAVVGAAAEATKGQARKPPVSAALDSPQRESLRAAMDEIIPASDGMPAASAVGGIEYLERVSRQDASIKADLEQALDALARWSESRFHEAFASISPAQRIETLTTLETQSPMVFAKLRDLVYESYYTQPGVWKLIGYELHPTNGSGPHMKPFDESVLAKVRKMPKLYREVSQG